MRIADDILSIAHGASCTECGEKMKVLGSANDAIWVNIGKKTKVEINEGSADYMDWHKSEEKDWQGSKDQKTKKKFREL